MSVLAARIEGRCSLLPARDCMVFGCGSRESIDYRLTEGPFPPNRASGILGILAPHSFGNG